MELTDEEILSGPEVSARVDAIDDFQTVKLSSRVMETEDPHTPKSIGRHHATSAPVPAACQ
jgi:hypothetical protein